MIEEIDIIEEIEGIDKLFLPRLSPCPSFLREVGLIVSLFERTAFHKLTPIAICTFATTLSLALAFSLFIPASSLFTLRSSLFVLSSSMPWFVCIVAPYGTSLVL